MDVDKKEIKVLVSAYACGPKWGSEIGMGWNWVIHLAQHCELTVITELGFKDEIEEALPTFNLKYLPKFYFIDIGEQGRKLFWKQGSFSFYHFYRKWQYKAYLLSLELIKECHYDLIHQLNMLGYREPGFLWRIRNKPLVWGPIGGFKLMPWKYLTIIGFKSATFFFVKNLYNLMQMYSLIRVRKAFSCYNTLIASTDEAKTTILSIYKKKCIVINETGSNYQQPPIDKRKRHNKLILLWCGLITGRKALPIAIKALARISNKESFEFNIVGEGPDKSYCMKLAKKLNISNQCIWYGQVTNKEVLEKMRHSDLLIFTSLVEGTPHVVLEALACGLPIICNDTCGQGAVVNEQCGIKIPISSPKESCNKYYTAIDFLIHNRDTLVKLAEGALIRSRELNWENKVTDMLAIYQKTIEDFQKQTTYEGSN